MSEQVINKKKAVEILQDFNDYRRNVGIYDVDEPCEPKNSATDIGKAIDAAIALLTPSEHTRDMAEAYCDAAYETARADFNITDQVWDSYHEGYLDAIDKLLADAFEAGAIYGRQSKQ